MRRLTAVGLAGLAVVGLGCASAGAPPGGPERHTPPAILSISPESGQTNVGIKEAEFKFDEVVSDRPAGAPALDQIFLVSPRDGTPNVSWHRNRITVRPRKGFRANTAYRITMLPGLADLRGNVRKEPTTILFSTGGDFPAYGIVGTVFDWAQEHPVSGAYIEAISLADTTLAYVAASDSSGRYDVGPMPAGTYLVRAVIDQNGNRAIDQREKWDSVTTTITGSRPNVELDLIERDSTPPAFGAVTAEDSIHLRVTFDKPLNPSIVLQPALFRLQRADSSVVPIAAVQWGTAYARAKVVADSIARAAADTLRRPPPPPAARPALPAGPTIPGGPRNAPPPPKPKSPPPETVVIITVSPATPLVPGRYVIFGHDLPNLVGHASEIRRGFVIAPPPPPAPRDTTRRTPADTTRRPPGRPPR